MTAHKHLKQLVRARMAKTGESYATARRHIVRDASQSQPDPAARAHLPGNIPATTALRVLFRHAGITAAHDRAPLSEAMLFGIAGGIGIGVFSFFYEKENFASFYVAGRHQWQDDEAYLRNACARFGVTPRVWSTGSVKEADRQLLEALVHGPCIAWVDAALLPHRAMPAWYAGGGYHVINVYAIRDDVALIGDRSDAPIPIPLDALRDARRRIAKFKNRLLAIPPSRPAESHAIAPLVYDGLRASHDGLVDQRSTNFTLEGVRIWAERLHGSKDKESWERVFAPGKRLWRGLTSIYDCIEHYGTGGGLCRPLFAEFLDEAANATGDAALRPLADTYAELGRDWSVLARAALPDDVTALRDVRDLFDRKAELVADGGPVDDVRRVWNDLDRIEKQADDAFPLSPADADALRLDLQRRVHALYERETAAHAALGGVLRSTVP